MPRRLSSTAIRQPALMGWKARILFPWGTFSVMGHSAVVNTVLYVVSRFSSVAEPARRLLNAVGVREGDVYGLAVWTLLLLGVGTFLSISLGRLLWHRFAAPFWYRWAARECDGSAGEEPHPRLIIIGGNHELLHFRARVAAERWLLKSEEVALKPLPSLGLAGWVLLLLLVPAAAAAWMAGSALFDSTWLTAPMVYHGAAGFFAFSCILLMWVLQWIGLTPAALSTVWVRPGGVGAQTLLRTRTASADQDIAVICFNPDRSLLHPVMFLPARGRPWSLLVPGRAIDLLVGAWLMQPRTSPESASE